MIWFIQEKIFFVKLMRIVDFGAIEIQEKLIFTGANKSKYCFRARKTRRFENFSFEFTFVNDEEKFLNQRRVVRFEAIFKTKNRFHRSRTGQYLA